MADRRSDELAGAETYCRYQRVQYESLARRLGESHPAVAARKAMLERAERRLATLKGESA